MPRKLPPALPEALIAQVEEVKRSYFISEDELSPGEFRASDEAFIQMEARISHVSPRHKAHLGEKLLVTLASARSYHREGRIEGAPFLVSITLRSKQRSLMAYLPPEPFWGLPSLLESGEMFLEAQFRPLRYGTAPLTGLLFGQLATILENSPDNLSSATHSPLRTAAD